MIWKLIAFASLLLVVLLIVTRKPLVPKERYESQSTIDDGINRLKNMKPKECPCKKKLKKREKKGMDSDSDSDSETDKGSGWLTNQL